LLILTKMNHDRMSSSRSEENTGEAAKLIAFMLDEILEVPVVFDSYRVVDNDDPKMTMILLHGDKPIDKDSAQNIAWEYGDSSKFNYIAIGHMHSRKIEPKNDGLRARKVSLPAFSPADTYGKTVAHPAMPGYQLVQIGDNGLPIVFDIPLNYDK